MNRESTDYWRSRIQKLRTEYPNGHTVLDTGMSRLLNSAEELLNQSEALIEEIAAIVSVVQILQSCAKDTEH